jgi:O-antigen/teichoic acid export membrane protein
MSIKLPGLRQYTANVLAIWLLQAGTLLFALISVPLITRRFGLEGLGVWLLVQQVASHVQLLELGLASSLGRFLSRDKALSNAPAYTEHASSAIAVLAGMGALLVLIATPLGMVFPHIFDLPQQLASDAVVMLAIAIVATGLALPLRSALGVLSSQHRFALIYGSDGLALLLRIVLIVLACTMVKEHALIALALAVFAPGLLSALVTFVAALRSTPYALFNFRSIGAKPIGAIFDVSFAAMLVTLAAVLLRQGSPMLVGYSLGMAALPLIALPIMLVTSLSPFLAIGNQLISPVASQLDASDRIAELHSAYVTAARYTLTAGLFMFLVMGLLVPYLLPLWLGKSVLEPHHAHLIHVNLLVVFGGYCAAIPALLARAVLISVGMHKIAAKGELMSVLLGLALGWMLMDIFGLGPLGMACGIAAAYLFRALGTLMRQLTQYFETSLIEMYKLVLGPPLLCTLPMLLAFIPVLINKATLGNTALFAIPALGLWSWFVYRLVVPKNHQERLSQALKIIITKRKACDGSNHG